MSSLNRSRVSPLTADSSMCTSSRGRVGHNDDHTTRTGFCAKSTTGSTSSGSKVSQGRARGWWGSTSDSHTICGGAGNFCPRAPISFIASERRGGTTRVTALSCTPPASHTLCRVVIQQSQGLRVLVWGENQHEQIDANVRELYPHGMHTTIAEGIRESLGVGVTVATATLAEPEHGLPEAALAAADVLVWWGHRAHDEVADEIVERVHRHVLAGLGLVVLHSAHWSKIFVRLTGTTCTLRWRTEQDRELVWTVNPTHPIAAGVPSPIVIDAQEMYGEFFDIPTPDELIFISSFSGGEVFRSGCTFRRGHGKIFYFSPGDQVFPVYHHPHVRRVIANGCAWAASDRSVRALPELLHCDSGQFEFQIEQSAIGRSDD